MSNNDYAGYSVGAAGDVNGDGLADLVVGAPDTALGTNAVDSSPRVYVVFGKAGGGAAINLSSISPTTGTPAGGFVINGLGGSDSTGIAVDTAGDFNGDGLADLIVGAARWSSGAAAGPGKAFLIYGKTDTAAINLSSLASSDGFSIVGQSSGDLSGWDVSAGGDINGDGFADLIISGPSANPIINGVQQPQSGITYVLFGGIAGISTKAVDFMGTSGSDVLNGTATTVNLNEQFVGGAGNDLMYGGGGADVMYGGTGNDTFVLNADNVVKLARNSGNAAQDIARINGDNGLDTIKLDGAGITLDLTAISDMAIDNVEVLDITGSGANTLKLRLLEVLDLGSSNLFNVNTSATDVKQQLMVTGNADDKVVLTDLVSWTVQGSTFVDNGHTYKVYNHNTANAQLLIDQLITNVAVS
jgi:hypothetical protein